MDEFVVRWRAEPDSKEPIVLMRYGGEITTYVIEPGRSGDLSPEIEEFLRTATNGSGAPIYSVSRVVRADALHAALRGPPLAQAHGPLLMTPIRVQLRRAKGWRMPPDTIIVDRRTVFGNPSACWKHGCKNNPCGCCDFTDETYCCVEQFREYVLSGLEGRDSCGGTLNVALDAVAGYPHRSELIRRLPELRGKNLACWCALDRPCHADVLLELANR